MGSDQSQDRSTHFQHPEDDQASAEPVDNDRDREDEAHCISISNKMVERLVEDATLSGTAAPEVVGPRTGYKDQMHIEKIRCLDESHTERCGLTQADMYTMLQRIAKRTENMVSSEAVCAQCKEDVIACYSLTGAERNEHVCWEAVEAFKRCVHETAGRRLRARTQRDAREHARRSRHVAHARENVLKDLQPPDDVPCM